jgi:ATP-binding cassette subfamily B protein
MISAFYGKRYSLNFFRSLCYQSKNGVSLQNIALAAEKIGFNTRGGKFTFGTLTNKLPLPLIVFWEQKHFVVVFKIKKSDKQYFIYVADLGKGKVKYSLKEFLFHWIGADANIHDKGIGLFLQPNEHFLKTDYNQDVSPSKFKFIGAYFLQHKKSFINLIIGLLIGSCIQFIIPLLTQSIVDKAIPQQSIHLVMLILLGQFVLLLSSTSIDFFRRKILLKVSTKINIALISDFFVKLMRMPMPFFDTKQMGDLLKRIEDHEKVQRFITTQSLSFIFAVFNIMVFGILLFVYDWVLFGIFLLGNFVYATWMLLFLNKRRLLDYRVFEKEGKNKSKVFQLINGMQEIKQQGCEKRKRVDWENTQMELFEVECQLLDLQQRQRVGTVFISEARNLLIIFASALAVIHGNMTLGMMLAVQYIIGQLNAPVNQIMTFIYDYQDVSICFERMLEIHESPKEDTKKDLYKCLSGNNEIIIKNLSFQYEGPTSQFVLKDVNLTIPKEKVTAIVGASGSGKTTLIKLLLGHYEPVHGEILIGAQSLSLIQKSFWRSQCGAVLQDGFIFSDTIARNIAVSDDIIDNAKLEFAAQLANIDDFIKTLPLVYKTMIGQDGQNLSQGQRQRILIARTVYKEPPFLFYDEATNALDANNERIIINNLTDFYRGKTVIIVAHRLSTVMNADNIAVINNGRIVEEGTHQELISLKKEYYTLVKNQLELGM